MVISKGIMKKTKKLYLQEQGVLERGKRKHAVAVVIVANQEHHHIGVAK
jgi:hypothetical protein